MREKHNIGKSKTGSSIQERIDSLRKGSGSTPSQSAGGNGGAPRSTATDADSAIGRPATLEEEQFLREFEQKIAQNIAAGRAAELMPPPQPRAYPPETVGPVRQKSNGNRAPQAGNGEIRTPVGVPQTVLPRPAPVAPAPQASAPPNPVAAPPQPSFASQNSGELPAVGAILELSTGQIVVFDRDIPEQQIQMVLLLRPDGMVKPEVLNLRFGCQYREIGVLPSKDILAMHVSQVWHRAQILFHLHNFADSRVVPGGDDAPQPPPAKREATRGAEWPDVETPALPKVKWSEPGNGPGGLTLHRGQRLRITMGPSRSWDCVYWGTNGQEAIVAHQTHGDWAVTTMNLSRFGAGAVTVEGEMTEREVWELEEILKRTYT